jgi:hypothetical protein
MWQVDTLSDDGRGGGSIELLVEVSTLSVGTIGYFVVGTTISVGVNVGIGLGSNLAELEACILTPVLLSVGSVVGTGDGEDVETSPVRMVVSCKRLLRCFSWSGARVDAGEGCFNAWTLSRMPAMINSLEEVIGMVVFFGNHKIVSQMCSFRVSQIQML